jgi:F-type H+-transporting ATPase subunit beta
VTSIEEKVNTDAAEVKVETRGAIGKVVQVTGPVVDIKFPAKHLPKIYNAIKIDGISGKNIKIHLTAEVMQHIGENVVRTVAMSSTDGLVRGMDAIDTGAPITIPVGEGTLGRIFNVLGETVDHDDTPVEGCRLLAYS